MAHMVKWKFSTFNDGKKGHNAKGYINYIAKQVKDRRENKSGFALENSAGKIGEDDSMTLMKQLNSAKTPEEAQRLTYLKYIHERKGSNGLFSDEGQDVNELVRKLCDNETVAWKPIVSLKESEAREYGLDTEAAWMAKGVELAEEYRKILGISKENYNWVAAFHTKSEADQNKDADAGCQPHLHFIMWETDPIRRMYKLNDKEMERVHTVTASVLSREYMQQQYGKRNELRSEIKDETMHQLEVFSQEVIELAMDIHILTGGKGKLNVKELEKRQEISLDILDKIENDKKLTDVEAFYKEKFGINNTHDAKRVCKEYTDIIDRLDNLADRAMKMPEVQELVAKWTDTSNKMRKAHGEELSENLLLEDYLQIQKEIKNAILKETRDVDKENLRINDAFKGMMIDRLENGRFKKNGMTQEELMESLSVITQLCKATNIPEEETKKMETQLLYKSDLEYYQDMMEELTRSIYANYRIGTFNVSTMDFWNTMRRMGYSRRPYETMSAINPMNAYDMANRTILNPISTCVINNVVGSNVNALLNSEDAWMLAQTNSYADYENKYNSLLSLFDTNEEEERELERVKNE